MTHNRRALLVNKDSLIIIKFTGGSFIQRAISSSFLALVFMCASWCTAQSSKPLSLSDAISIAHAHNPRATQYREKLEEKKCDDRAAFGNFLPLVTLNAGYTAMNAPLTMDLDPVREAMISLQSSTLTKIAIDSFARANAGAVSPAMVSAFGQKYNAGVSQSLETAVPHFIDTLKKQYYPSANLTVVQPLFMGGKVLEGKKAALADENAARFELIKTLNEITQETFNNYCAVELLKAVTLVRKDVLDGMHSHEKDAERLCEAGMIAKTNFLRARVAVAEAQRSLDEDLDRLMLARLALVKSIGLPDTIEIDVCDSLALCSLSGAVEDYLMKIDDSQPILSNIRARSDAARANVAAQRAEFMPHFAAFGKIELFQDYLSVLEPQWVAGVTMSMDIFAGTKNIARFSSARHLAAQAEASMESARGDIRLWVRKAFLECLSARRMYGKLTSDETLATENLRQCKSRFENGYATSLDVIDAELALEKNRVDKITTLYNFNRAFMDLCTATGEPEKAIAVISLSKETNK